jgi:3-phosphoshikimate 1-carboxyvinyltransferase
VKESDRLAAIVDNLKSAGADINETETGFEIRGHGGLSGGSNWQAFDDHRMAMTGIIAGMAAQQAINVDNESCVAVSYPEFIHDLKRLTYN